jgi:PadR family transcriptional regulator, regulatory protein PadR
MNHDLQWNRAGAADLCDVFVHLHVLHAASRNSVEASQLLELLTQRGYNVSNEAMSALLRRFERRGWLNVHKAQKGSVRLYHATREGKTALQKSKPLVSALFKEISAESAPK